MRINKINLKYTVIGLFLILIYIVIFILFVEENNNIESVKILGFCSLIQVFFSYYSWCKIKRKLIDSYVVFLTALFAFTLSQPILEALELSVDHRRLWDAFGISKSQYIFATVYTLISVSFFHVGAILASNHLSSPIGNNVRGVSSSEEIKNLKYFSIFIAVLSFPFYIGILITQYLIVKTFGYAGLYNIEDAVPRIFEIISAAFIPAMLILFCISIYLGQKVKLFSILVAIFVFLPPLVLGGRSNAMIIAAIFLIVYSTVNKIEFNQLIKISFISVLLIFILNIVGKTRAGNDRSIEAYQDAMDSDRDNPILETISEMGWSMYPTALTTTVTPSKIDYSYGASYFWAIVSVIPNLGFWEGIHPGKANDPGHKLNELAGLGYGIGYSIVAGTYNEFGIFGVFIMMIYGIIFSRVFNSISTETLRSYPVKYIIAILVLWFSIKFVRNSFDSFVRCIVFYVIPFYLVTCVKWRKKHINTKRELPNSPTY